MRELNAYTGSTSTPQNALLKLQCEFQREKQAIAPGNGKEENRSEYKRSVDQNGVNNGNAW